MRDAIEIDHRDLADALLQHRDARVDDLLALLGRLVLGVLPQVAVLARDLEPLGDVRATVRPKVVELGLEPAELGMARRAEAALVHLGAVRKLALHVAAPIGSRLRERHEVAVEVLQPGHRCLARIGEPAPRPGRGEVSRLRIDERGHAPPVPDGIRVALGVAQRPRVARLQRAQLAMRFADFLVGHEQREPEKALVVLRRQCERHVLLREAPQNAGLAQRVVGSTQGNHRQPGLGHDAELAHGAEQPGEERIAGRDLAQLAAAVDQGELHHVVPEPAVRARGRAEAAGRQVAAHRGPRVAVIQHRQIEALIAQYRLHDPEHGARAHRDAARLREAQRAQVARVEQQLARRRQRGAVQRMALAAYTHGLRAFVGGADDRGELPRAARHGEAEIRRARAQPGEIGDQIPSIS